MESTHIKTIKLPDYMKKDHMLYITQKIFRSNKFYILPYSNADIHIIKCIISDQILRRLKNIGCQVL